MQYVNVDPVGVSPKRFNSSTATLSVPAGARVVRAFLYWGADLARGVTVGHAADGAPGGETRTPTPLGAGVSEDRHRQLHDHRRATARPRRSLEGHRELVQPAWQPPRLRLPAASRRDQRDPEPHWPRPTASYATVANVQAGKGNNRHGGWTLVVVWENDTAVWRNLTLFDGFDFVQVSGGEELVVGPLRVQRLPDRVERAGRCARHDLDLRGRPQHRRRLPVARGSQRLVLVPHLPRRTTPRIRWTTSSTARSRASGVTSPAKPRTTRTNLGYDLDAPSIPEGTIHNGATAAAVCLGIGRRHLLLRRPGLRHAYPRTEPRHHQDGRQHQRLIRATSSPTRSPSRTRSARRARRPRTSLPTWSSSEPIPSGLEFVRFVINPPATPLPIDSCGYNAGAVRIDCKVGTLQPDGTFTYSYQAQVTGAAQGSAPATLTNTACFQANSEDQPASCFDGCASAGVDRPACAAAVRRSRRDEDGLGDDRQAGRQSRLDARCTQLRARRVDQLHRDRRLPGNVGFASLATSPSGLTCTTPPSRLERHDHLHGCARKRSGAAGAWQRFKLTIVGKVSATTADGTVLLNVATVSGMEAEPVPDPHPQPRQRTLPRRRAG